MKNDYHIKGWAPTLVWQQRPGGTRKWPIGRDLSLQLVIVRVEGFFFFSSKKTMGFGSFILLFTIIFREEDMRNSWTHFWHKLYGNCYTFNKGINDVGETTEVMNSSQAGLGNWLKFLQQTFILDFVVRYCISVLNSSEGRDRCTFWSLPNWISFIFLLNLSHGTRSYWEINIYFRTFVIFNNYSKSVRWIWDGGWL